MKKTYLSPVMAAKDAELLTMLNASITQVGGNSNINIGTGETPTNADSRRSLWDDDELEEEENW